MKKFDIIGKRKWWYIISILLLLPGIISIVTQGFNLGIDFTGGTLMDLKFSRPVTVVEIRDVLKEHHLDNSMIQLASNDEAATSAESVLIRTANLSDEMHRAVLADIGNKLGHYEVLRTERVGAVMGSELTMQAIWAMFISWALIILYVSYRFEFKFALAAVLALVHDTVIVIGVFSLLQIEIDATFVAAILTIIGYSINDTIVIFDRIRENLKLHHRKNGDLVELADESIWQTMTRSVYTVLTVLFTTAALYFFGGETTKNFSFALLVGFICGAYSSIFTATPLWITFKNYADRKKMQANIKTVK
ncbi:protein translocase subunit SecF [Anaerosinus massiliensis]|uniref:protein translocase subunit SecF n=1 Tax=Massilibacillus massiliensis TaxID=1806837 RepID=UPI000A6E2F5A|nr:protein translocase subunit SecF [Massilibacillus massiliensis]